MALPAWRSSKNPNCRVGDEKNQDDEKSGRCRTTPERMIATSIIHGMGPQKYDNILRRTFCFFSSISFGPYWASRFVAST